jgi:hypothetical protein
MFLFGFNPIGRFSDFPAPGTRYPGGPSWRVTVANLAEGSAGGGRQRTIVYCAPRRAGLHLVEARKRVAPGTTVTATATCPPGTEAVSGGFSDRWAGTMGPLVFGFRSRRVGSRGWQASAINTSSSGASTLIVMVSCDPLRPHLSARTETITVPAARTNSSDVDCGRGRHAWSAGFESPVRDWSQGGVFPYLFKRIRHRAWRAAAFSTGPPAPFTLHVYCGQQR